MKRVQRMCFLGMIMIGWVWTGTALSLTLSVDLRPEVSFLNDQLVLEDIAVISFPDPAWEHTLRRLDLGYVPALGEVRIIRPQEIFDRVVGLRIPGLKYIYFTGSDHCRVVFSGDLIPWSQLSEMISRELLRIFPFAERVDIIPLDSPQGLTVAPGSSVQVNIPTEPRPWGRINTQFAVSSPGGTEQRTNVTVGIKVIREMVRVQDNLRPGDIIREEQVQVIQESLTASNERGLSSLDEVVGYEVRRAMRPGDIISPDKIQSETLIHRGDLVTMVVKNGFITVTATGRARGNGSLGDVIVVENPESRKRVQAEVVGERVVEVVVQ